MAPFQVRSIPTLQLPALNRPVLINAASILRFVEEPTSPTLSLPDFDHFFSDGSKNASNIVVYQFSYSESEKVLETEDALFDEKGVFGMKGGG